MTFFESVKGTVCTAVDTIASVTQDIVEKNRTNAKLNRLRLVMKSESELMNRAYIALGKGCYDSLKKGEEMSPEQKKKLFDVIDSSKAKIAKARDCYREIIDTQNDKYYGAPLHSEYNAEDVVDITVACSNEDEYSSSPFPSEDAANKPDEEASAAEEQAKPECEECSTKAADPEEPDDEVDSTEIF